MALPDNDADTSLLSHALAYASVFHWPVFPLHSIRGGRCTCVKGGECIDAGKHPRTVHGVLDATTDERVIRSWWGKWPDANIGLATGERSGIVVVDIDPRHGGNESLSTLIAEHGPLPETVEVLTGGGGRHLYFVSPNGGITNKGGIVPGIDVRGSGGYVATVPSTHRSGRSYLWELSSRPDEISIADLPDWLLTLIRTAGPSLPQITLADTRIPEGQRNSRLASLGGAMRRRGAGLKAIEAGLVAENEDKCEPPLSEFEVLRIARSVARYEPEAEPPKLIIPKAGARCAEWLDTYIEYAQALSPMTPRLFHESSALWLLSTAIARRLTVSMPFGKIYPNLYCLWLAETTLYRKTTGQAIARDIAEKVVPYLLSPHDCTPEALLNDMAGTEPPNLVQLVLSVQDQWRAKRNYAAQRGMILDEMSGLLSGAGRDYNAGLIETYLRFYDCEGNYIRSTRGQGWQVVRNAYVSLIGASTPAAMAPHMGSERLWSMGWWPRFAILTPPEEPIAWKEPQHTDEPPALINGLRHLAGRLPQAVWPTPVEPLTVDMDEGSFELWRDYNRLMSCDLLKEDGLDRRLYGTYGRLPTQAMKVATVLSALDWPLVRAVPIIEERHMQRALTIAEEWRASAHRALSLMSYSEQDITSKRVLRLICTADRQGITLRDIGRGMRDANRQSIQTAIDNLLAFGEIEAIERKTGGRSALAYVRVTE